MLRRLLLLLGIAGVFALVVWYATRPKAVPVVVEPADRGRVERSVANTRAGSVNACRRAKLAPASGGQIAALPVREGDRVREGQVLLELWSDAAAAESRVALEQSRGAALRAEEVCVSAETAQREAARARKLHGDGLLPDEQRDRAIATAEGLQASCRAARSDVQGSQARLAATRASLTRTTLRAPFDGVVARITGEIGEFATPSPPGIPTPPAVDLIDDSCLYVTAPIDEVDAPRIRVGQPAYVTIDAVPGKRFPGRVRRIASYVLDLEKQARTVDVEVEFTNPEEVKALMVGYSADAEIILDVAESAIRVPTTALLEGNRVLILGGKQTLEERKLQVGVSNWQYTEVLSGLRVGEKVVTSVERKGVVAGAKAIVE